MPSLLNPPTSPCITAMLVLAAGSRAGTEAPLAEGYYMIGRHADCQIRPKSKSVSRRHCLVHHDGESVRIFDLGSTSGTAINEVKIKPKSWVDLTDGDLLSLGKIGFHLRINQVEHPPSADSIVTGDAWDTFDVVGFLDSADEADRAVRYEKIRSEHRKASDSDVLDGEPYDQSGSSSGFTTDDSKIEGADSSLTQVPAREARSAKSITKKSGSGQSRTKSPPKKPSSGFAHLKSVFSLSDRNADRRKLTFAAFLAVLMLGLATYKAYQFSAGPPVRVLHEID